MIENGQQTRRSTLDLVLTLEGNRLAISDPNLVAGARHQAGTARRGSMREAGYPSSSYPSSENFSVNSPSK